MQPPPPNLFREKTLFKNKIKWKKDRKRSCVYFKPSAVRQKKSSKGDTVSFVQQALYRKFETKITRNETAWPHSQFPRSCICERFIYTHNRSANFAVLHFGTDRGNIHINHLQIHECGNWGSRQHSFISGIFVLNFRYSAFAVGE